AALVSHRGWDPGALDVARPLARRLRAPLVAGRHTRLLVDLNRSPTNRGVFSAVTRALPAAERTRLIDRHHRPHWTRVREAVDRLSAGGRRVVHVAVHSFAPTLGGVERAIDVGLLYDPHRGSVRALCRSWRDALAAADPS